MGRYVAGEAPAMDRLVEETVKEVGAEIKALAVPRLQGVVLGGGYGRGEGGVFDLPDGGQRLSNDLDFFAVTEKGASGRDIRAVADALAPVSEKWTAKLEIDVDFVVRTPWRMRHDQERVMIQELMHGYFDVVGKTGEEMFVEIERRPPSAFPWSEAARARWLEAAEEVMAAGRRTGALRRSLYQAARWVVRRRTLGDWRTFGQVAAARLLRALTEVVRARGTLPPSLRRDWEVFN